MSLGLLLRLLLCLSFVGGLLYSYIDRQNDLTELKMKLPEQMKELHRLEEETRQLRLEVERMERPETLLHLLQGGDYPHLHYPCIDDVVVFE